jgi:hypothetical protein
VNYGDNRIIYGLSQLLIEPEQRGMVQFVLEKHIKGTAPQALEQGPGEIVTQTASIASPGQGDNFDLISLASQALYQHPVVEEATGDGAQAAVDNQADPH